MMQDVSLVSGELYDLTNTQVLKMDSFQNSLQLWTIYMGLQEYTSPFDIKQSIRYLVLNTKWEGSRSLHFLSRSLIIKAFEKLVINKMRCSSPSQTMGYSSVEVF